MNKKVRLYAVLLICFCVIMFGGCGGSSENGSETEETFSIKNWCCDKTIEGIKEVISYTSLNAVFSYEIREMIPYGDLLDLLNEGESIKVYNINLIGAYRMDDSIFDDGDYYIESYVSIIYKEKKVLKENDIVSFSGVFRMKSPHPAYSDDWTRI